MIALWLAVAALADPVEITLSERGSGDPVDRAQVQLSSIDQIAPDVTAVTDDRGRAVVDLARGAWLLTASPEDYWPAEQVLAVPAEREVRLFLRARPPFTVVVEAFRTTPHTTRHAVDAEQALETPGTHEDPVRLVQSLPGVSVQREYSPAAGELVVRGSAPGDNRFYLDGVEIPYLYHYNQYASVFPTAQIESLELFSSTFGSAYGDAVGAVIDARSKGDRPEAVHGSASLSFVMGGGSVTAPLPRGWWVSVAGRRSYQDLFGEQTAQFTLWPVFYDYSVRAGRSGAGQPELQLFAWGAGDGYERAAGELDLLDPVEAATSPSFRYRRGFQVLGASIEGSTPRQLDRLVVAFVNDRRRGDLWGEGRDDLRTRYLTSRLDHQVSLAPGATVSLGWEVRAEHTALAIEDAGSLGLLVAEEAPGLARGVSVDGSQWRLRAGAYAEGHFTVGDPERPLMVIPGVRIPVDTAAERAPLPEPRLSLRWRAGRATAFKLGAGRYEQGPETEHLISGAEPSSLPDTRSWQLAAGVEQTIGGRLELALDGYGKWLDDVLVYPVDGPAEIGGRGRGVGVELLTRYRLRELLFVWGWVALSRTVVVDERGAFGPAEGDQPVVGGVVISWDVAPGYNLGARYRLGTGLPYTPVAFGLYDATRDQWVPVAGDENTERLPLYQKLDLHAARTWELRRWTLTIAAEVWWVPKSAAQLYPTWNYDYTEQGWVIGPQILPLLSARAKF